MDIVRLVVLNLWYWVLNGYLKFRIRRQRLALLKQAIEDVGMPYLKVSNRRERKQMRALCWLTFQFAGWKNKERQARLLEVAEQCEPRLVYRSMMEEILESLVKRWRKLYPDLLADKKTWLMVNQASRHEERETVE